MKSTGNRTAPTELPKQLAGRRGRCRGATATSAAHRILTRLVARIIAPRVAAHPHLSTPCRLLIPARGGAKAAGPRCPGVPPEDDADICSLAGRMSGISQPAEGGPWHQIRGRGPSVARRGSRRTRLGRPDVGTGPRTGLARNDLQPTNSVLSTPSLTGDPPACPRACYHPATGLEAGSGRAIGRAVSPAARLGRPRR